MYYPLSVGEIWVDSDGCKWYIYECINGFRYPNTYRAKCIDGFNLGKFKTYYSSGESVCGCHIESTLIKKVV